MVRAPFIVTRALQDDSDFFTMQRESDIEHAGYRSDGFVIVRSPIRRTIRMGFWVWSMQDLTLRGLRRYQHSMEEL